MVFLVSAWTSPPQASAQLGSLVVDITSPTSGSTVSGTITVRADVSIVGALTVAGVQFKLDGVNLGPEDTTPPYSMPWNTTTASNGSHTLTAVARDGLGVRWTSDPVTVTVDNIPPAVSINQATSQTDPTNASPLNFTVAFSEPVSGFTGTDVTIAGSAGGTKTVTVTGGPATYNVAVSGMTSGTVIATIAAGAAFDAAGNGNPASTSTDNTVTFDTVAPTVTINQAAGQADPTNASPIHFTVAFSEPVSDFTAADVAIAGTAGGTKTAAVTGGPTTYNVAVSGMTSGTVIATVAAGVARDAAGNANTASTSTDNTVTFDTVAPAVTINQAAGQADPASAFPINFTVVFSEPVSDFAGADVTIAGTSGGTRTVAVTGGPTTYNVAVSGMTDGTVIATIAAGVAHDAAGNGNPASTSTDNTVTFDTVAPTVTINQATGQADPTSASPINFAVVFSEPVSDFAGTDVTIAGTAGGTKTVAVTGGPATYNVAVSGMTDGTVIATIAAGVARDAAGIANTASTSADNTVTFNTAPTVSRIQETSTAIVYTGSWVHGSTARAWSGVTAAIANGGPAADGSPTRATLSFSGTGVSWIGFRGPQTGIARVHLDGTLVATVDLYAAAEEVGAVVFTASGLASGSHTLAIESTGTKNASSSDILIIVDAFDVTGVPTSDTTPPTVAISAPSGGAAVSGIITVSANASDDVGVVGVQFLLDGAPLGAEDTTTPYSVAWNTTTAADGSHTLTAVARDAAGRTTTSAAVTVTVSNTTPFPVATRFENTDPSIAYTDGSVTSGSPPDWWHGSRSRAWSDDTASFNRAAGARAAFTFTGTAVRWVGFRAPWAGIGHVFLDGAFAGEFDLYSTTDQVHAAIFSATGLAAGSHTLTVEVTGLKNPSATDNAVVMDAFDVAPALPPPTAGTRFEETASSLTYTAGWTQGDTSAAWSGGTAAGSTTAAARATFAFTGTSVSWIGLRGPQTGIARVFLDGAFHAQVDTYSPGDIQAVVYTATGLAAASHTLAIEVTGLKNPAATGHRIVLDAFDVRSRFEDPDSSITYTVSDPSARWILEHTQKAWSGTSANTGTGTAALSATAGARAEFTFTGTQVTWIGFRGPIAGIANVSLDGSLVATLDLYSPTEELRVPVFTRTNLVAGQHTLRIDVTGQMNPSSTGSFVVVDAFDVTLPSPAPPVSRFQQTDPSLVYTPAGDWTQSGQNSLFSGLTVAFSATAGAQTEFTFTGTSIRWIGQRRRDSGIARVFLDGAFVADIDTFAPLQDEYQAVIFGRTGLAPGAHTLRIVVTGLKNPGSSATTIYVDAFEVY